VRCREHLLFRGERRYAQNMFDRKP